jgi:hypothetical protein
VVRMISNRSAVLGTVSGMACSVMSSLAAITVWSTESEKLDAGRSVWSRSAQYGSCRIFGRHTREGITGSRSLIPSLSS